MLLPIGPFQDISRYFKIFQDISSYFKIGLSYAPPNRPFREHSNPRLDSNATIRVKSRVRSRVRMPNNYPDLGSEARLPLAIRLRIDRVPYCMF